MVYFYKYKMTITGALIGGAVSAGTVYYLTYVRNFGMYAAIWSSIAIYTVYRLIAKNVPFLDMSPQHGQSMYITILEFLIGMIPLVLYYKKFGVTGVLISFVLNVLAGVVTVLVLKI
jgi:hypothetical protein